MFLRVAQVVGSLAAHIHPEEGAALSGVLVTKDFSHQIVAAEELDMYTQLGTTSLTQKLHIGISVKFSLVAELLGDMFDTVDVLEKPLPCVRVFDAVSVTLSAAGTLLVEWVTNPVTDMLADSVMACIAQAQLSPAAVKGMYTPCGLVRAWIVAVLLT